MGTDIGYIRTSKKDQKPEPKRHELKAFGCGRIYEEQISSQKGEMRVDSDQKRRTLYGGQLANILCRI